MESMYSPGGSALISVNSEVAAGPAELPAGWILGNPAVQLTLCIDLSCKT